MDAADTTTPPETATDARCDNLAVSNSDLHTPSVLTSDTVLYTHFDDVYTSYLYTRVSRCVPRTTISIHNYTYTFIHHFNYMYTQIRCIYTDLYI